MENERPGAKKLQNQDLAFENDKLIRAGMNQYDRITN
jgi:hypothetical protein